MAAGSPLPSSVFVPAAGRGRGTWRPRPGRGARGPRASRASRAAAAAAAVRPLRARRPDGRHFARRLRLGRWRRRRRTRRGEESGRGSANRRPRPRPPRPEAGALQCPRPRPIPHEASLAGALLRPPGRGPVAGDLRASRGRHWASTPGPCLPAAVREPRGRAGAPLSPRCAWPQAPLWAARSAPLSPSLAGCGGGGGLGKQSRPPPGCPGPGALGRTLSAPALPGGGEVLGRAFGNADEQPPAAPRPV